jgi:hypothetical protein
MTVSQFYIILPRRGVIGEKTVGERGKENEIRKE